MCWPEAWVPQTWDHWVFGFPVGMSRLWGENACQSKTHQWIKKCCLLASLNQDSGISAWIQEWWIFRFELCTIVNRGKFAQRVYYWIFMCPWSTAHSGNAQGTSNSFQNLPFSSLLLFAFLGSKGQTCSISTNGTYMGWGWGISQCYRSQDFHHGTHPDRVGDVRVLQSPGPSLCFKAWRTPDSPLCPVTSELLLGFCVCVWGGCILFHSESLF